MLLVLTRAPSSPEAVTAAARAVGLTPAEVRMRIGGPLPRVLLNDSDGERITAALGAVRALGFAAFTCDPVLAPGDDARVIARRLERKPVTREAFAADGLVVVDAQGVPHDCPADAVALILRAARTTTRSVTTESTQPQLSIRRGVLTGGLLWTKNVEKKTTHTTETREELVVLHRRDTEAPVILYERRLDYRFLGDDIQPASRTNFDLLVTRLRALMPQAIYDDRIARPGFLSALPTTSVHPTDLALFLVTIALSASPE